MEPAPAAPAVRPISRAATRPCSRPSCATPANATLLLRYAVQEARVVDLIDEADPAAYDLCDPHAARTTAPRGWALEDDRSPRPLPPSRRDVDDLGATVRVLAEALHGRGAESAAPAPTPTGPAPTTGDPSATPGGPGPTTDAVVDDEEDEDPLRAALEAVQRVVEPDDEPAIDPVPLRRRVVVVDADDPDAEPELW